MIHFSLFGIPVSIQPFFWITLALIGGAFRADSPQAFLELGLFVLAGFISVLVHELGHALTIKSYKVPTSITLQAFGGYATYPARSLDRVQSFLVTAAGPATQLVLALVAHIILHRIPYNEGIFHFLTSLKWISIIWAVLNLLPVLPLDGGQLVNALLGPSRISITLWITILTAVTTGVAMFLLTKSILFPIFMGFFAYQAVQALRARNFR